MADYIFKESQNFRRTWSWPLFIGISILVFSLFYFVPDTSTSSAVWLAPLTVLAVFFLLFSIKMETRIDNKSVQFRYFPFISSWRKYSFGEIDEIKLISYNSLWEFGGWGIRFNLDSWLYNTGGKHGIKITSGKKRFILGTFKPQEALKAIAQFKEYKSIHHAS